MRVLWVKMGGLWPLNTGGRQRSFQLLRELSRRHQVVLVTTAGLGDEPAGLATQLGNCERIISVPHAVPKRGTARFVSALARSWLSSDPVDLRKWRVGKVRQVVSELVARGDIDLVIADSLFAVPNVPLRGSTPVVLFAHNVEHLIWQRMSQVERRWWIRRLLDVEWRKIRRVECQACQQANLTIAVSPEDRSRLAAVAPGADIVSIPTGVNTSYFHPVHRREIPGRLVFSGSMDWYPNEDAILHFIDQILPRVRQSLPEVSMTVIGRNPTERVRTSAARSSVELTGTVPDVRPHVAEGELYVVPMRIGGGTRLKIFEALAMEKAVLSTSVGAEGLTLVPGRHIVLADDPEEFSKAVVSLLLNRGRRRALGREGRRLVEDRYSWTHTAQQFEGYLQQVSSRHGITHADPAHSARVSLVRGH